MTLYAATEGPGLDCCPIILIHGMGSGMDVWDEVARLLERDRTVYTLSLAGHVGGVTLPPRALTMDGFVQDVERQLDELGIEQAHLVGNSMGAWLALCLAERGRALSVTCLAPAGGWRPGGLFEHTLVLRFLIGQLLFRAGRRGVAWVVARPWGRSLILGLMVANPRQLTPDRALVTVLDFADCQAVLPLFLRFSKLGFERLPRVDAPVTVVWSERDRVLPKRRARARFSELESPAIEVQLAGVGHVPMLDDPEAVAGLILSRLELVVHECRLRAVGEC